MIEIITCPFCAEDIPGDATVCPFCVTVRPTPHGKAADQAADWDQQPRAVDPGWDATCAYCAETIPVDANICPYCQSLTPLGKRSGHDVPGTSTTKSPPVRLPAGFTAPQSHFAPGLTLLGLLVPTCGAGPAGIMYLDEDLNSPDHRDDYLACTPDGMPAVAPHDAVRSRWRLEGSQVTGMHTKGTALTRGVLVRGAVMHVALTDTAVRGTMTGVTAYRHLEEMRRPTDSVIVLMFAMTFLEINTLGRTRSSCAFGSLIRSRRPMDNVEARTVAAAGPDWAPRQGSAVVPFAQAMFAAMLARRATAGTPEQRTAAQELGRKDWRKGLAGWRPVELMMP